MRRFFENYFQRGFWRNVLTLMGGTGASQVLSFLFIPVIARLYAPEAFGIAAIFVAIVVSVSILINGGYEMAIMLPKEEDEAKTLLNLSLRIAAFGSILCLIIVMIPVPLWNRYPDVESMRYWIPLAILSFGLIQPLSMFINRKKAYRVLAQSKLAKSIARITVCVALGLLGWGFEGLIWGFLAGQLGQLIMLLIPFFQRKYGEISWRDTTELKTLAKQYSDFPRWSMISNGLNTAAKQLPFFLVPILFFEEGIGETVNGLFSKADQILHLPIVLISMSVGSVFYEQASKASQKDLAELAALTRTTFWQLVLLAVPFLLLFMLAGPWMFKTILGDNWEAAGRYASYLVPWVALSFIVNPLSWLVDVRRKLKVFLFFNLALFIGRFLVLYFVGTNSSPIETILAYSILSFFLILCQLYYLLKIGGFWSKK